MRYLDGLIYWLSWIWCAPALSVVIRLRCWGQSGIPRNESLILAGNHQSFLDPILAASCIPRQAHFMARESLFRSRAFAALIRRYQAFPVRRDGRDVAAFRHTLRLLKRGQAILLFPEGTRSLTGQAGPVQSGVIALARRSNTRIVPIALEGAFDAWPRHSRWPRRARVWITFGPPIDPERFARQSDDDAAALLTAHLRELHNQLRRRAGRAPIDYSAGPGGDTSLPLAAD